LWSTFGYNCFLLFFPASKFILIFTFHFFEKFTFHFLNYNLTWAGSSSHGQSALRLRSARPCSADQRFKEHFQPLNVAAPAKIYDDFVSLPPYLLPVNLQSPTEDLFKQVRTVVAGAPSWRLAVDAADTKLIDVPNSYAEKVVECCFAKFGFRPESMSVGQTASGLGLVGRSYVAHWRPLRRVIQRNDKWVINQGTITVQAETDEAVEVEHFTSFQNRFWAWPFVLILWLIPPYRIRPPFDGEDELR
jgi:hypothetical protein